jgi:hypothetical protein
MCGGASVPMGSHGAFIPSHEPAPTSSRSRPCLMQDSDIGQFSITSSARAKHGRRAVETERLGGGVVDAELAGEIDRAAGSRHFHNMAVARRLLHGVGIRKTFSWVRLAQRIPVRIVLDPLPDGVSLISGRTATVAIAATRDAPPSPLDWLRQWLPRGRSPDADHGGRRLPKAVGKSDDASPTL